MVTGASGPGEADVRWTRHGIPGRRFGTDGADLAQLWSANPMFDATIEEICGRRIRIGHDWLIDFASCNYLGLDLEPAVMAAVETQIRRWGIHPSWSRLLG